MVNEVQREIAEKKARIAEMRRQRELKQASEPVLSVSKPKQLTDEVDKLVDSLIGPSTKYSGYKSNDSSRPASRISDYDKTGGDTAPLPSTTNVIVVQEVFDIKPRMQSTVTETYSKETQTDAIIVEEPLRDAVVGHAKKAAVTEDDQETLTTTTRLEGTTNAEPSTRQITDIRILDSQDEPENLSEFLNQSLKVIGRAIEEDYDILVNYGSRAELSNDQSENIVSELIQFSSDLSQGRAITGLDWSSNFSELVASSHTEKRNAPNTPKGLVQIWNLHVKSRPEYVFNAQSDILSVKFSPFEPNLVFGTAYNGQIMTWDLRSGSEPILKSPLTGSGHAHPVYTIQIIGTHNANNLVTSSTDGTVCTWSSDLLAKPQDKIFLTNSAVTRNDEVSPTALSISPRHPVQFAVGTEEGTIFQCNRYDGAGARAGVDTRGIYKGHRAPVTALDYHSSKGAIDFGDYLLSSSMDWSIKLWKTSAFSGEASHATAPQELSSVAVFRRDDMVYDVKWSPRNPSIFGAVDGSGHLEIWDLNADVEAPQARIKPTGLKDTYLNRPLNRLAWGNDNRVAVGGIDGIVTVFDTTLPEPQSEDWSAFKRTLNSLSQLR